MKQQAQFDYSLADLIGLSVARLFDSNSQFPTVYQAYPHLFEEEVKKEQDEAAQEEIVTTNSMNNFLAFAMKYNAKMRGVETENYDNGRVKN